MSTPKNQISDALVAQVLRLQAAGKSIVFTNGCFDLVHAGHVALFRQARALGDVLIVAINSDESVRRLKGEGRPIFGEKERAEIITAFEMVDFVLIFEEDTPLEAILKVRPNVLVKGADWINEGIVGQPAVESWGGEVVTLELVEGKSTTAIIQLVVSRFQGKQNAG